MAIKRSYKTSGDETLAWILKNDLCRMSCQNQIAGAGCGVLLILQMDILDLQKQQLSPSWATECHMNYFVLKYQTMPLCVTSAITQAASIQIICLSEAHKQIWMTKF